MLRGELPWQDYCFRGTIFGRYAHIREKKRAWTGSRLAEGHHPVFGQLLDYARGLEFRETIDYGRFRAQIQDLQETANLDDTDVEGNYIMPSPHTQLFYARPNSFDGIGHESESQSY